MSKSPSAKLSAVSDMADAPPSAQVAHVEITAHSPLNSGDAMLLGQVTRIVRIARGQALGHRGMALREFAVSWRDAFITHKPGDVVLADDAQRAFLDANGIPVEWSTP
jgi:hypothetical protein